MKYGNKIPKLDIEIKNRKKYRNEISNKLSK